MHANSPTEAKEQIKGISKRLVVAWIIFGLELGFFVLLTHIVASNGTADFDAMVFAWLQRFESTQMFNAALGFTFFGSTKFLLPAYTLLAAWYLFYQKNRRLSLNIAAVGLSSVALLYLLKNIFKRHRPPDALIKDVIGFSYPSGHSFSSFTFCGILMYITWKSHLSNASKYIILALLFLFACCVALSRVYLHVHYASDVTAGFCLSLIWLSVCFYVLENRKKITGV